MSYLVLARKWRPQTFSDLIGQEHVSKTLKNAIDSGRVAHAFLFTGARGVGKTSSARILAKTLNCENGPTTEPCNECAACREITEGNSVDVFEIDGASNRGIESIRELRDNVKYLPAHSRYKIIIIDEVHMLTTEAFNALLKTLEEPPPHIKFIFATTEPQKVPITILSRCQRFDFKRIPLTMIIGRLRFIVDKEGVGTSDTSLAMIARKGDGSMRDSLSALDQILAFCGDKVEDADVIDILGVVDRQLLLSTTKAIFARDTAALLQIVAQVDTSGYNMRTFCNEMIELMRTLLLLKSAPGSSDLLDLSDQELTECTALVQDCDILIIQRFISILLRTDSDMAHSSFSRLLLEMAMIRMATISPVIPVNELLERLRALENRALPSTVAGEPAALPYRPTPLENRPVAKQVGVATAALQQPQAVDPPAATRDWHGFVAFVKAKKPMLASKLEKGSPLQISADSLQIGYPRGTLELSMLQDADYQLQLAELATAYYGNKVQIRIVPLSGNEDSLPLSIAEKKTAETARNEQTMKAAADSHPMVVAALEIFGGEIVDYKR